MEGVIDAAALSVTAIVRTCLDISTCREELLRVARFSAKLGLLLTEVRLTLLNEEDLRGSKAVFLAVDGAAAALRQAEQLVEQCAASAPSSIWPLEDAVRFQSVAAELCRAAGEVAALGERLPRDLLEDAAHVHRQAALLSFTQAELSETEEQELERVQHHNSLSPDPSPPAAQAASHPVPDPAQLAAPAPSPAVVAAAEAGAAPPAAPLEQFTSPAAALVSGAAAASQEEAARAAAPPHGAAASEEAEQRRALQSAAAVAVESAAEVLSGSEGEAGGLPEEERGPEVAAEEAEALEREMREDASACQEARGVVVTRGGDTALPPQSPAKGAVPTQGGAPLPPDPFDMSGAAAGAALLGPSLPELQLGVRGPEEVGADVERQLDSAGPRIRDEPRQGGSPGSGEAQALAGLRRLPGLEASGAGGAAAAGAAAQVAGSAGQDAPVLKEHLGDEQAAEGAPASAASRPQPSLHSHALADSP